MSGSTQTEDGLQVSCQYPMRADLLLCWEPQTTPEHIGFQDTDSLTYVGKKGTDTLIH